MTETPRLDPDLATDGELRRAYEALIEAQFALAESERRYRTLGELIPYGFWICGRDGSCIYASQSFLDLLGITLAECQGLGWMNRLVPEDVERTRRAWLRCVERGDFWDHEFRVRARDGRLYTILSRGAPIRDEDEQVTSWVGINLDISERKRAEEERERLLAEMSAICESTNAHLALLDRDFDIVLVNSAYVRGSGHTREELVGRNHFALFPNAENEAIFARVRDTGEPYQAVEKPFEYADQPGRGVTYWDWVLVPIKGREGECRGLLLSLMDETQQVRARQKSEELAGEAQRRAAELDAVITSIADGVVICDRAGGIVRMNPAAERLLGYMPEERGLPLVERVRLLGMETPEGKPLPPEESAPVRALRGESVQGILAVLRRPPDRVVWLSISAGPLRDSSGEVSGAVVTFTDVTALHERRESGRSGHRRALPLQSSG